MRIEALAAHKSGSIACPSFSAKTGTPNELQSVLGDIRSGHSGADMAFYRGTVLWPFTTVPYVEDPCCFGSPDILTVAQIVTAPELWPRTCYTS